MNLAMGALLAASALAAAPAAAPAASSRAAEDRAALRRTSNAFADVAEKALPSVVFISVEKTIPLPNRQMPFNDPFNFFGEEFLRRYYRYHGQPGPSLRQRGQGSGFLISKDGYILTNNHVVGDADKIRVTLSDGREFLAERVGSDAKTEVAVIRIKGDNFPFLPLGDSGALRIAEWVMAIGNPFGLAGSVTVGIVSAKGRTRMDIADYEEFIQTDAAINPGNSGGPLLNLDGEVVGINTAIYSESGGNLGIGFAIPINLAITIKDQLVKSGRVVRGYLGIQIQDLTSDLAASFGLDHTKGIAITRVEDQSPAAKAGLQAGDVITKLNGDTVETVGTFRNRVSANKPGTELSLTVLRDGEQKVIKATTGAMPGDESQVSVEQEADSSATGAIAGKLGLTLSTLTEQNTEEYGYAAGSGVLVTAVAPGSPAAEASIEPGDLVVSVNRRAVRDPAGFKAALEPSVKTGTVLLRVSRGADTRFVVVHVK